MEITSKTLLDGGLGIDGMNGNSFLNRVGDFAPSDTPLEVRGNLYSRVINLSGI